MRVISANVNGIRAAARRGGLSWLTDAEPDVLCLQEVRASDAQLTRALADAGFGGWHVAHAPCGTAGRAGVAVLSRAAHRRVRCELEDEEADVAAGRWVEAELDLPTGPVTVVSVYVHTGEAQTPRQADKYRFLDAMTMRMKRAGRRRPSRAWWPATSTSPTPGPTCATGRATSARPASCPRSRPTSTAGSAASGSTCRGRAPARWRARTRGGPGAARPSTTTPGGGSTTSWPRPRWPAGCRGTWVGRAATYAERWSDHAAVVADYDLA